MDEHAESRPVPFNSKNRFAATGALWHAALVTVLWWFMIYADQKLIPVRLWFALGWAWIIWPIGMVIAWSRASRLTVASTVAGAAVIAPAVSTIYSFTVWLVGGFAP